MLTAGRGSEVTVHPDRWGLPAGHPPSPRLRRRSVRLPATPDPWDLMPTTARLPVLRNVLARLDLLGWEGVGSALADAERTLPPDREAVVLRLVLACLDAQQRQATQQIAGSLAASRQAVLDLVGTYIRPDDTALDHPAIPPDPR